MIRTVRAFLNYAADRKNQEITISVRIVAVRMKRAFVGSSFRDIRVFQVRVKNDHFFIAENDCIIRAVSKTIRILAKLKL